MARKIIILDRVNLPSDQDFRVVFWLDVPASRQAFYAKADATSEFVGATPEELAALRSGAVVERVLVVPATAGTGQSSLLAALVNRYNAMQAEFTARNPWARYGSSWDGSAWTPVTVA